PPPVATPHGVPRFVVAPQRTAGSWTWQKPDGRAVIGQGLPTFVLAQHRASSRSPSPAVRLGGATLATAIPGGQRPAGPPAGRERRAGRRVRCPRGRRGPSPNA